VFCRICDSFRSGRCRLLRRIRDGLRSGRCSLCGRICDSLRGRGRRWHPCHRCWLLWLRSRRDFADGGSDHVRLGSRVAVRRPVGAASRGGTRGNGLADAGPDCLGGVDRRRRRVHTSRARECVGRGVPRVGRLTVRRFGAWRSRVGRLGVGRFCVWRRRLAWSRQGRRRRARGAATCGIRG